MDWRLARLRRFHFLLRLHGSTDGQALLLTADNFWSEFGSSYKPAWHVSTGCPGTVHRLPPIWLPPAKLPLKRLLPTKLLLAEIAHKFCPNNKALLKTYIFICVFSLLLLLLVVKRVVLLMLTSLVDRQEVPPSLLAGSHLSGLLEEIVQDLLLRPRVPRPGQAC